MKKGILIIKYFAFALFWGLILFNNSVYYAENINQKDEGEYVEVQNPFSYHTQSVLIQDINIQKVKIGAYDFTKEELFDDIEKFTDIYINNKNENGLNSINIIFSDGQYYSLFDYIKLQSKNVDSIEIMEDKTWIKENSPYHIKGQLKIANGATLTIEPGVEVILEDTDGCYRKSGILVDGSLIVNGTNEEKVLFKPSSNEALSGLWEGIYVSPRGIVNINHSVLEKAGNFTESCIYSLGKLTVKNTNILNNSANGIVSFGDIDVEDSIIENHNNYGIDIYANNKEIDITLINNTFINNNNLGRIVFRDSYAKSFLVENNKSEDDSFNGVILYGEIINDMTLSDFGENIPYVIPNRFAPDGEQDTLIVREGAKLILDKTVVKIGDEIVDSKKANIVVKGDLVLDGTEAKRAYLTSINNDVIYGDTANDGSENTPSSDNWEGIIVTQTGTLTANYANIEYGGYNLRGIIESNGALNINNTYFKDVKRGPFTNTDIVIKDSVFEKLDNYGFYISSANKDIGIDIENNKFKNIDGYIGRIQFNNSGSSNYIVSGNDSVDNKYSGIQILGNITYDMSLDSPGLNIPYIIPNTSFDDTIIDDFKVEEGRTLTINNGAVIKFDDKIVNGKQTNIMVDGLLICEGEPESKVVFTSIKDDSIAGDTNGDGLDSAPSSGDWGSITLNGTKDMIISNKLNNAIFSYGGDGLNKYTLKSNGYVDIQNSVFKNNSENAIVADGKITVNSCNFENNDRVGIKLFSVKGFNANITNNTFRGNKSYAATALFQRNSENLSVSSNIAVNNSINGFGLTGVIDHDFNPGIVGENFPYVIYDSLSFSKTLTLPSNMIIKFQPDSIIDIGGKLISQAVEGNEIYLTSIKDDEIGGDTNGDNNDTQPEYGDWIGLNYNNGSEALFDNTIMEYALKNMDAENINYVKANNKTQSSDQSRTLCVSNSENEISKYSNGICKRIDLTNDKEYYMFTNVDDILDLDLYENNIAILSQNEEGIGNNVLIGNIDTCVAQDITNNRTSIIKDIDLYKDMILLEASIDDIESLLIYKSDGIRTPIDDYTVALGYDLQNSNIVNNQITFEDETLEYVLDTDYYPQNDSFVTASGNKSEYSRKIEFGKNFSYMIGAKTKASAKIAEAEASIKFKNTEGSKIFLGIDKNSVNSTSNLGVGREKSLKTGTESEVQVGLGFDKIPLIKIEGDVLSSSVSGEMTGKFKVGDMYYFDNNDAPNKRKLGALITSALLKDTNLTGDIMLFGYNGYVLNITRNIIGGIIDKVSNYPESSVKYQRSIGNGVKLKSSAHASLLHGELSSEGLYEVGIKKEENDIPRDYLATEAIFEGSYGIGGSIDITIGPELKGAKTSIKTGKGGLSKKLDISGNGMNLNLKFPINFYEKEIDLYYRSELFKDAEKAIIKITAQQPYIDDYVKIYKYTIDNTIDFQNAIQNIPSLKKLYSNGGSTASWSVNDILEEVKSLFTFLSQSNNVGYEIILKNKTLNDGKNIEHSIDGLPYNGVVPMIDITISNDYKDVIEIVIDKGSIIKGELDSYNNKLAFVPIDNNNDNILKGTLVEIAKLVNPFAIDFELVNDKKIAELVKAAKIIIPQDIDNIKRAQFTLTPIDMEEYIENRKYSGEIIVEGNSKKKIIKSPVWIELINSNNEKMTSYPLNTELELYIGEDKWNNDEADNYVIYRYDVENRKWNRLGGQINKNDYSISIEIVENGQYAVGLDMSEPDIEWSISNNTELNNGNVIVASIKDTDNISQDDINVKLINITEGKSTNLDLNYNESRKEIKYYVNGTEGCSYELEITYSDEYDNSYRESIHFSIPSVN